MMQRILALVQDRAFWVASGIFAVLLNIVSSYIKEALDQGWARYSESKRESLRVSNKAREERVLGMALEPALLADARHSDLRKRIFLFVWLLFSLINLILADISSRNETSAYMVVFVHLPFVVSIAGFMAMTRDVRRIGGEVDDAVKLRIEQQAGASS